MANEFVQTMADARVDARSLSEFVFKPAGFKVARRLAPTIDTLQFYIDRLNALDGDFSSSVSVALSSLNNSVAEAHGKVEYIETTVQDAINNTAVEGGVLADTFVTATAKNGGVARTQRDKNSDVVSIKDFGAKGDGVTNDTLAFVNAISYANARESVAVFLPQGRYVITEKLPKITSPLTFYGENRHTTSIFFDGVDGLNYDLSEAPTYFIATNITGITFITNTTGKKGIYFKGRQTFGARDSCLTFSNCSFVPLGAIVHSDEYFNQEWAIAVHCYDTDEIVVDNCFFCGSRANAKYNNRTDSKLLLIDTATGVRVKGSSFFFGDTAIEITGQSEGAILSALTIVAMTNGVVFKGLTRPSNNHIVDDSHFSCYHRGINFELPTGEEPKTLGNFITNCFIAERNGTESKVDGYIGINAAFRQSGISNCHFLSGAGTELDNIGVKLWNGGNSVSGLIFRSVATPIYVVTGDDVDGTSTINSCHNTENDKGVVSGDTHGIIYSGIENKTRQYEIGANEFLFHSSTNESYFAISGSQVQIGDGSSGPKYLDFKTTADATTDYDVRIMCLKGKPYLDGRGNLILYAENVNCEAHIIPYTDNVYAVGSPTNRWATIYSTTGTIVTSDERLKQDFRKLKAAEKEAAIEIKDSICLYKMRESVEEKGDGARWHVGVKAQQIVSIMESHGLQPFDYGFICYDEWDALDAEIDDEGNELQSAREAGNKYAVRYDELAMFIFAAI